MPDLEADKKYVVKWCNALRKEVKVGATSRLKRGFWALGCDPISETLWGVGVRATGEEGDTVILRGVKRNGEERERRFDEPTVARFIRNFRDGLYPELHT